MSEIENNSKDLKPDCKEFGQEGATKTSAIVKEQPSHLNLAFHSCPSCLSIQRQHTILPPPNNMDAGATKRDTGRARTARSKPDEQVKANDRNTSCGMVRVNRGSGYAAQRGA
jgi:hypothetical protein